MDETVVKKSSNKIKNLNQTNTKQLNKVSNKNFMES